MTLFTEVLSYGQGGLIATAVATVLCAFPRAMPYPPRGVLWAAAGAVVLVILAQFLLSTWSLFSPTYIDHIEASVASITHYYMQGIPVYPDLGSYTFHGLLYGPLLPELNSLGYLVSGGVLGSKLVGWAAAWLAVLIMALLPPRSERNWAWGVTLVGVGALLTSFGRALTADRADSLLLLCATLGLGSVLRLPKFPGLIAAALLAGLAANLKLHGPVYLLPALALWVGRNLEPRGWNWLPAMLATACAGVAGLVLPFLPSNVSPQNYLAYLRLGAKHGLRLELFAANGVLLLAFWLPTLFVLRALQRERAAAPRDLIWFGATLLVAEFTVSVIAAKPGAGVHHFLPFLPFHAFLLHQLLPARGHREALGVSVGPQSVQARRAAVTGLAAVLVGAAWPAAADLRALLRFDLQEPAQWSQYEELQRLADTYPHGMLGIAGGQSYASTIYRPWITLRGTLQTDYGAWMDWSLSGLSDAPLVRALQACKIPYLFVPAGGGSPFSMVSNYGSGLLFSDAVRSGFSRTYALVQTGQYFDVYGCSASRTVRRAR